MFLILLTNAWASQLDDEFPKTQLPTDDPAAIALLGPAATVYDGMTSTPEAATLYEREVEAAWGTRKLRPAPDTLRRWGHIVLTASKRGELSEEFEWFAAEHVGLPAVPMVLSHFTSGGDAKATAELLKDIDAGDDVQALAVVTEPIEGGVRGLVVVLSGVAEFEPFPRVWSVGDVASVPGTALEKSRKYALYVCGEGPKVDVYDLPTTGGRFDLDLPLPAAPGAYRVTMSAAKREGFPSTSFFFTLYVGQQPPTAPVPIPALAGETEDAVVDGLNAVRARYGLPALTAVGDRDKLRAFLDKLPEGEVARARAMRALGRTDPVPEVPHGTWGGLSTTTDTAARAAWVMAEHPVNRRSLLDADARYLLVAADPVAGGKEWLGFTLAGVPAAADLSSSAAQTLSARFAAAPKRSATIDAELSELAARAASGDLALNGVVREAGKIVKAAQKAGRIKGGATMNAYSWAPGVQEPPFAELVLDPRFHALGVAVATGDLGKKGGIQYAVAVVVAADDFGG